MSSNGVFEMTKNPGITSESKTLTAAHSKPFSSLAYLAKSTAALSVGTKISNGGHNGFDQNRNSNLHHNLQQQQQPDNSSLFAGSQNGTTSMIGGGGGGGDFGGQDENFNRTWDLKNFIKRIPPALMTPAAAATTTPFGNGSGSLSNGNDGSMNSQSASLQSLSKLNSLDCWDYTIELELLKGPQDLQLAAELGKTLLERNKELESALKQHQNTIEDQAQEIVYLQKQTAALREVNDSRLKIYEQLEVGIQDLERANHRLIVENTGDKKHIKSLVHNIETLDARIDELNRTLEETRKSLAAERRKNERLQQESNGAGGKLEETLTIRRRVPAASTAANNNESQSEEGFNQQNTSGSVSAENCPNTTLLHREGNVNSTGVSCSDNGSEFPAFELSLVEGSVEADNDEILRLVNDLEATKKAFMSEQRRCGELEEQLVAIIQENQALQNRIVQTSTNDDMKSMHEELSMLEEVRQGTMCSRCLRSCEDRITVNDEQSSIAPTEEEDDRSLLGMDTAGGDGESSQVAYRSSVSIKAESLRQSCPICSKSSKYLHELPISLESLLLQIWQKVMPRAAHPDSLDLNAPPASPNPYRDLVEKYEALLEVQRHSMAARKSSINGLSLAEEFQSSGEFNTKQKLNDAAGNCCNASSNGDGASSCNGSTNAKIAIEGDGGGGGTIGGTSGGGVQKNALNNRRTPTEFSEAETSSSGFSDETSNKYTQTDVRPGFFLCSIGDGEDCKFSIYDDVSPIDSRFRNRPEYRELFKEIFAVLKKAAENKEEGERLPLLDDTHPVQPVAAAAPVGNAANVSKVPPVTPANEEISVDFSCCDDTQSIVSSAVSEQSFAMSECITKLERRTAKKHIIEKNQENKPPICGSVADSLATAAAAQPIVENGRVLTPLKREPLEYVSVGVGVKKKNRRKNRNFSNDRSESPAALPSPPKFYFSSGKKRKDMRPFVQQSSSPSSPSCQHEHNPGTPPSARKFEWNGSSMVIYNRGLNTSNVGGGGGVSGALRGRELDLSGCEYRPSTVSQDLHKLKKLDLSYAEVLRRADACKHTNPGHHHHHRRK